MVRENCDGSMSCLEIYRGQNRRHLGFFSLKGGGIPPHTPSSKVFLKKREGMMGLSGLYKKKSLGMGLVA